LFAEVSCISIQYCEDFCTPRGGVCKTQVTLTRFSVPLIPNTLLPFHSFKSSRCCFARWLALSRRHSKGAACIAVIAASS